MIQFPLPRAYIVFDWLAVAYLATIALVVLDPSALL